MNNNLGSNQPITPLSVGNVIGASLRIYRDHFKLYYSLAFIGYLWIIVPVYGWAKYSAMLGLLSRLVFHEVIERPESVNEARRYTNRRKWSFLGAGILVSLIFFAAILGVGIVSGIVGAILAALVGQSANSFILLFLLGIIAFVAFMVAYVGVVCRLFLIEVPLAIENEATATSTIRRSWELTKGNVWRILGIVIVAFLLTLPLSFIIQIVNLIVQVILNVTLPEESLTFLLVYYPLLFGLSIASGALFLPFWQGIKGVIYSDLCSRQAGIEVQPRDSANISISEQAQPLAEQLKVEADLSRLRPDNFSVIRDYLQRRSIMPAAQRTQFSRKLAHQIKDIILWQNISKGVTANLFLEAVYLAYQQQSSDSF